MKYTFLTASILAFFFPAAARAVPAEGQLFQRMIVVVLENTNYDEALRQPFMTDLAKRGALLANFDAESHPSQPNYIAMISGSTQGVSNDKNINLDARHLGDLLEDKGYDWRAYAEGFPGNCYLGASKGNYARKHVPFLSFRNVQSDAARCAKVVNASRFDADVAAKTLPEFSFFVPDLQNDGHDTSPAFADSYLKGKFGKLLNDPAFMEGTLFVLTFDENDDSQGQGGRNQVYTALVGPMVTASAIANESLNHYSLLRLVEDNWSLDRLTRGDGDATAISGIWANH